MATTGGPQQDIVTRLCGLPTAAISDAMDRPGTLICADADGVVAVPAAGARGLTETAARIERIEAAIVAAARAGSTLRAARETFGYHTLQTRQP
jgi:regulator of RNase E activity RraA